LADPEDPDLFLDAYMFAEPAADLNNDQFVDSVDSDLFWQDYFAE
jgi:hypothetical protein